MPRQDIPVQTISRTLLNIGAGGTETTPVAVDDCDFANDGGTVLLVRNSGVTTRTVEVVIQQTVDGVTPAVKTYSLLTGAQFIIGPFAPAFYNVQTTGRCQVNVDHTEVRLSAFRLGV